MRSECIEAFERNECEKYGISYDDMKKNWDWYESQYGWRYPEDSPRGQGWKAWEKAWQHRQTEVDELKKENLLLESGQKSLFKQHVELQKRVDKAIRYLVEAELYQSDPNIDLAVQALKGGGE